MSFTISVISVLSVPRTGERLWVQWGAKYASGEDVEAARAAAFGILSHQADVCTDVLFLTYTVNAFFHS